MSTIQQETFFAALREAMAQKVREALEAEIEPACDRLRARLREQVGHIVLSMMEHYSAYERGHNLVITVRSPQAQAETVSSREDK
jgi:molybdopterin converting factor small subunit